MVRSVLASVLDAMIKQLEQERGHIESAIGALRGVSSPKRRSPQRTLSSSSKNFYKAEQTTSTTAGPTDTSSSAWFVIRPRKSTAAAITATVFIALRIKRLVINKSKNKDKIKIYLTSTGILMEGVNTTVRLLVAKRANGKRIMASHV
jgi:hypothetical protein